MQDFSGKYRQKLQHKADIGEKIKNKHNYLKEYQAGEIMPNSDASQKASINDYLNFLKRRSNICSSF